MPKRLQILALSVVVVTVVLAVAGIGQLRFNSHYSAYFAASDPLLLDHLEIQSTYGRDDTLVVALESPQSFLSTTNYQLVQQLGSALSRQPVVDRVYSIGSAELVELADQDGIPQLDVLNATGRVIGYLLSEDTLATAMVVQLKLDGRSPTAVQQAVGMVRESVHDLVANAEVSVHYSGTIALNEAYINTVRHDLSWILPILLALMLVVLRWALGRWSAVAVILPVGLFAVLAAFGLAGLLGAELAAINSFTPVIILTISLAGCVHMMTAFQRHRRASLAPDSAALAAMRENRLPMLLANGTTALGFLGLLLSPSPPIQVMGYLVATGVTVSWVLCMTLVPCLQARFDPPVRPKQFAAGVLVATADIVRQRRRWILVLFLGGALPAAYLASTNTISDNVFAYFPSSHPFSQDTQLVEGRFSGINEATYSLGVASNKQSFLEPDGALAAAKFSDWLQQRPEVIRVRSLVDNEPIREAIADDELAEFLDFVDEQQAEPGFDYLVADLSSDRKHTAFTTYLVPMDSGTQVSFDRRVHQWVATELPGYTLLSGGPTLMFAYLGQHNIKGMLTSLGLALVFAAVLLWVVFRSTRIALAGLVCNILPIVMVYAIWALVSGQLSLGAAIVMGMVLGIVLDDSIYLLAAFSRAHSSGDNDSDRTAIRRIGPAMMITTLALVAGLSTGLLSDFGPIWSMSMLSVLVIAMALIIDLLLLPAMLRKPDTTQVSA